MCLLSNNIYDYVNVSQGKITIPNVDDGEECTLTDVSPGEMNSWIHTFLYLLSVYFRVQSFTFPRVVYTFFLNLSLCHIYKMDK